MRLGVTGRVGWLGGRVGGSVSEFTVHLVKETWIQVPRSEFGCSARRNHARCSLVRDDLIPAACGDLSNNTPHSTQI